MEVKSVMAGILRGLEHMAYHRVMHRDIKPENIILRAEGGWDAVIADFGLATEVDIPEYLYVRCGTPGYVAP
jgi:serine/threonine protein kinase